MQPCVTDFLTSPSWWPRTTARTTARSPRTSPAANVAAVRARIATAYANVRRRCATRATPTPPGRCSCRTTRRRCPTAPDSATPRAATPGRAPAAAASGTPTPTGRTRPRCRRSTAPSPARSARRHHQRPHPRPGRGVQRPPAVRARVGLYEEKGLASWTHGRRRRPDRVGQPDPHRVDVLLQQPLLHPGVAAPELLGAARRRSCVRQAYNGGTPRGGTCTDRHRPGERRAEDVAALRSLRVTCERAADRRSSSARGSACEAATRVSRPCDSKNFTAGTDSHRVE